MKELRFLETFLRVFINLKCNFQFATEIARFTAVETDSFSKPFQKLMFIIRDWISPEEYEYGIAGGNKFIKTVLEVRSFHTTELKTVRQYLQKTFETIDCFLMPYPGKSVARNSTYNGRWKDIDEDFLETMKELFPIILAPGNLTIKTINGASIKAFELSVYVKQYVELFKSENMPEAKSIYDSTLDKQYQLLISKAVEVYLESISLYQEKIKSPNEVEQLHNIAKSVALKYFDEEKKFGSSDDAVLYQKELVDKLEKAYNEWKPITLEFLGKIKSEQEKAETQNKLASDAETRNVKAKQESQSADKNYVELKTQITQLRYDTDEARREAEVVKQKFAQAERERQQALDNENEARRHYEEMKQKAEVYENQLAIERQTNAQKVKKRVVAVRQRDGVLQWFGNGVANFFDFISQTVRRLFSPW